MMLFEDLLYLELSAQRLQNMIARTEEVEEKYKAELRFEKDILLGPLYKGSNHTSIEILTLLATIGKNDVIRLFRRKCMCLLEPFKMVKIHFCVHKNKFATREIHFM